MPNRCSPNHSLLTPYKNRPLFLRFNYKCKFIVLRFFPVFVVNKSMESRYYHRSFDSLEIRFFCFGFPQLQGTVNLIRYSVLTRSLHAFPKRVRHIPTYLQHFFFLRYGTLKFIVVINFYNIIFAPTFSGIIIENGNGIRLRYLNHTLNIFCYWWTEWLEMKLNLCVDLPKYECNSIMQPAVCKV